MGAGEVEVAGGVACEPRGIECAEHHVVADLLLLEGGVGDLGAVALHDVVGATRDQERVGHRHRVGVRAADCRRCSETSADGREADHYVAALHVDLSNVADITAHEGVADDRGAVDLDGTVVVVDDRAAVQPQRPVYQDSHSSRRGLDTDILDVRLRVTLDREARSVDRSPL